MKISWLKTKGTWRSIADSARVTIGMESGIDEPSSTWKWRMLMCEHSPIRKLIVCWKWVELKYWVSVHFVRHKFGIEHWVRTQRSDRTGVDRDEVGQGALVEHECEADAQTVITISRKRLCRQASPETREAWQAVIASISKQQPELARACAPDCIYRGWCYEYKSCGYHLTPEYWVELDNYRGGINSWKKIN